CSGKLATNCVVVGKKNITNEWGDAMDKRETISLQPKTAPVVNTDDTDSRLWGKRLVITNIDPKNNYFIPLRTEREIVSAYKATLRGGLKGKVSICAKGGDITTNEFDCNDDEVEMCKLLVIPACEGENEGETGGQWCKRQTGVRQIKSCAGGDYRVTNNGKCERVLGAWQSEEQNYCSSNYTCNKSYNAYPPFIESADGLCFAEEGHKLCVSPSGEPLCQIVSNSWETRHCSDVEDKSVCGAIPQCHMVTEEVATYGAFCSKSGGFVNDTVCATPKPTTDSDIKALPDCPKYKWEKGEWGFCSNGNNPSHTRTVECVDENGAVVNNNLCPANTKPATEEDCKAYTYKCETYVEGIMEYSGTVTDGIWQKLGECINPREYVEFDEWFNNGETVCSYEYPNHLNKLRCKYTNPCDHCTDIGKSCIPPESNVNEPGLCRNEVACPCLGDAMCEGLGNKCMSNGNCMYCEK
ncbi:hypothetical protein CSB37_03200, partial [bacterium DOLZORAL124_38_8]